MVLKMIELLQVLGLSIIGLALLGIIIFLAIVIYNMIRTGFGKKGNVKKEGKRWKLKQGQ